MGMPGLRMASLGYACSDEDSLFRSRKPHMPGSRSLEGQLMKPGSFKEAK